MVWIPDENIAQNEIFGRRLIDSEKSPRKFNADGKPILDVGDFLESRPEADLSFDRFGHNPTNATIRAITKVADEDLAGQVHPKVLSGWQGMKLSDMRFPKSVWVAVAKASPTRDGDGNIRNHWHADVSRDGLRADSAAYFHAIALRDHFDRRGRFLAPIR